MNRLLAIDPSTTTASIALVEAGTVMKEREYRSARSHNSQLFEPLGELLREYPDIDTLVVGTGPGSYTGIRIGIAAVLAVAMARDLPILPLPSVLALADDQGTPFAILGDARRGKFFHGRVDPESGAFLPLVGTSEEVSAAAADYVSDGLPLLLLDESARAVAPDGDHTVADPPTAGRLAQAVAALSPESITIALAAIPLPIYLQAPFTTTPKKRAPESGI